MVGEVRGVFIPNKHRKGSNTRFGFVRYRLLEEALAAVKRWNGVGVGGGKLQVKLADKAGWTRRSSTNDRWGEESGHNAIRGKEAWKPGRLITSPGAQHRGMRTHREAKSDVGKGAQNEALRRKVKLVVNEESVNMEMILGTAETKEAIKLEELEELTRGGVRFREIAMLGKTTVLIQFNNEGELDAWLTEEYPICLRRFKEMKKWIESDRPILRWVWVSIIGLPLKAWSERNIEEVVSHLGKHLRTEESGLQNLGLRTLRIQIETSKMDRISEWVEAEVDGNVYDIMICEEGKQREYETEKRQERISGHGQHCMQMINRKRVGTSPVHEGACGNYKLALLGGAGEEASQAGSDQQILNLSISPSPSGTIVPESLCQEMEKKDKQGDYVTDDCIGITQELGNQLQKARTSIEDIYAEVGVADKNNTKMTTRGEEDKGGWRISKKKKRVQREENSDLSSNVLGSKEESHRKTIRGQIGGTNHKRGRGFKKALMEKPLFKYTYRRKKNQLAADSQALGLTEGQENAEISIMTGKSTEVREEIGERVEEEVQINQPQSPRTRQGLIEEEDDEKAKEARLTYEMVLRLGFEIDAPKDQCIQMFYDR